MDKVKKLPLRKKVNLVLVTQIRKGNMRKKNMEADLKLEYTRCRLGGG